MTVEAHQLALYTLAYLVMVASPGPFVAAIAARSAAFGMRDGVAMAVGGWIAEKIWIATAILGLAALAASVAGLLTVLKYIGAAWLLWLGATLILGRKIMTARAGARPEPFWRGIANGFLINIGNPKAALFFMALFPGFFDMTRLTWVDGAAIIAVSAPVGLASDCSYAWAAARARLLFGDGPLARRVDLATGGVLAACGVAIAAV